MRKDEGERTRDATSLVSALDILLGYQKAAASIKRLCKSHRSVDSEIVNDLAIEADLARHSRGDSRIRR
jgi:fumarate hydratase class II